MRRMRRASRWLGAAAIAAAFLGPGSTALAASPAATPEGNPAVDQYTETFPSAAGPRQASSLREGEHPAPAAALGRSEARRLREQGPDGRALAELAAASAPPRPASARHSRAAAGERGSAAAAAVAGQAFGTSSGKLGLLLPLFIVVTFLWSLALLRKRRPRSA